MLTTLLRYRRSAPAGDKGDTGPVLMPKLFRRLSTFAVNKKAKMVTGGFTAYVHKKAENYYLLDDFISQGPTAATPRNLSEILDANDVLLARPQDLVFHEGAKLLGPNGKPRSGSWRQSASIAEGLQRGRAVGR